MKTFKKLKFVSAILMTLFMMMVIKTITMLVVDPTIYLALTLISYSILFYISLSSYETYYKMIKEKEKNEISSNRSS